MPCRPTTVAFRDLENVGHRVQTLSGFDHTARLLAVYASPRGLPRQDARLASGCLAGLPGGAGYPLGCHARFRSGHDFLLAQA